MTRDPFPDHAAFRRLEQIARGAYGEPIDPRPAASRPRRLGRMVGALALRAGFLVLAAAVLAITFGWRPW